MIVLELVGVSRERDQAQFLMLHLVRGMTIPLEKMINFYYELKNVEYNSLVLAYMISNNHSC
jgi:hypothetical protein